MAGAKKGSQLSNFVNNGQQLNNIFPFLAFPANQLNNYLLGSNNEFWSGEVAGEVSNNELFENKQSQTTRCLPATSFFQRQLTSSDVTTTHHLFPATEIHNSEHVTHIKMIIALSTKCKTIVHFLVPFRICEMAHPFTDPTSTYVAIQTVNTIYIYIPLYHCSVRGIQSRRAGTAILFVGATCEGGARAM